MRISVEERRRREAEKKRKQRERAKCGRCVLSGVEIIERDTWIEILRENGILHGVATLGAVRLATERYIWDECRAYKRDKAQQQLNQLHAPVTGLLDRETGSVQAWRLIKAKKAKRPGPDQAEQDAEARGFDGEAEFFDEGELEEGMDPSDAILLEGGYEVVDD
jgi:hypothetical protein